MKKFMFLHCGFEEPTPEIMEAWGKWFESIADKQVAQGGFSGGREISRTGTEDLPWGMESITGYNIIEAEDFDEATIDYFKGLAEETGIPYQTLINLYLRDCAARRTQLDVRWRPSKSAAAI